MTADDVRPFRRGGSVVHAEVVTKIGAGSRVIDPRTGLDALVRELVRADYRVVGPTVSDAAIVHDDVMSGGELPDG